MSLLRQSQHTHLANITRGQLFRHVHPTTAVPSTLRTRRHSISSASRAQTRRGPEILQSALGGRVTLYTILALLLGSSTYLYVTDTRASIHSWAISPLLRLYYTDAEDGHAFGIAALANAYKLGLHPRERNKPDEDRKLEVEVFGQMLSNPIAISGGLDKNAEAATPLFALGPAIVEVGGITPLPQYGNSKPRVWRIPSQAAIINRYGLNNEGADAVALRLRRRVRAFADKLGYGIGSEAEQRVLDGDGGVPPGSLEKGKLLAVQIAKNKDTPDDKPEAVKQDYVTCVQKLGAYADIIVVNVSSPNTAGLRNLQKLEPLRNILSGVVKACGALDRKTKPKVMVKVSPDESSDADIQGICQAVWQSGVDGVIVANTTKSRPAPNVPLGALSATERRNLQETGGYSGPALLPKTLELIKKYRKTIDMPLRSRPEATEKVIFASGGICTGEDALAALNAGASIAMTYTAMSYYGSGFVTEIKNQMRRTISRDAAAQRH